MNDTAHFREQLAAEKDKLEAELLTVGRRNPSSPTDWEPVPSEARMEADPNDQADLIENFEENTAILKDLEIRYNLVLAALARIEDGSYGTCTEGGEEIEAARLAADPAAATCLTHMK
ncbi:MAG: TraR/DksA family transcriptional regulator [Parcubacteria group bacterium]|nr:TraR/DksA family transcriptional regulator [Parcubacteria group bacterium]